MEPIYERVRSAGYEVYREINMLSKLSACTELKLPAFINAMDRASISIDELRKIISTAKLDHDDSSRMTGLFILLNQSLIVLQRKIIYDMILNKSDSSDKQLLESRIAESLNIDNAKNNIQRIINEMYKHSGLIAPNPESYSELHDGFLYNGNYYISSKCFLERYNSYTDNDYSLRRFLEMLDERHLIKVDTCNGVRHRTHHCIIKSVSWIKFKRFVIYYPQ